MRQYIDTSESCNAPSPFYPCYNDTTKIKIIYVEILRICKLNSKLYAKQKQPGCKKVRGQSEATMVISDQNL